MRFIVALVVSVFVGSPLVAVAVAVMRASDATIDRAITMLAGGVVLVLAAVAVRIVWEGKASYRQAQFPAPSHNIDARRQTAIDARQISQPAQTRALEELI